MVTLELFHHYPIFSFLEPDKLVAIAAISKEEFYEKGDIIYREKDHTDFLYILVKGSVDLLFKIEADNPELKELPFGKVAAGEIFGLSALLEPYIHTSTARASRPSQVVKIDAAGLMALCKEDSEMAYRIMRQVAKTTLKRLNTTRLQLALAYTKIQK
jgi:CRP/FNR family transcriptional regulator, cyclic AMP receptor protein